MKSVAIVGAGAAGLCICRHFAASNIFKPKVFEKASCIGGTWRYDGRLERRTFEQLMEQKLDDQFCTSSLYRNLRTNLPKEVMAFPDFDFGCNPPLSFVDHNVVQEYLESYCEHFDLKNHIQLRTEVIHVEPREENPKPGFIQWSVTIQDLESGVESIEVFDSVVICNGHFDTPRDPKIENLDYFKGLVMHSRYYKNPEPFTGKVVAILGFGSSGKDISIDIAHVAQKVYACHSKEPNCSTLLSNIEERQSIVSVSTETGDLILTDGSHVTADALIFCTGYSYNMPFLSKRCQISLTENDRIVMPLYRHMLSQVYPSLAFIGIPFIVCPFPLFNVQALYLLKVLSGKVQLPSREVMEKEFQDEMQEKVKCGLRPDQFHQLGERQWTYHVKLGQDAGFQLPLFLEKLYRHVGEVRDKHVLDFRQEVFAITEDKQDFSFCKKLTVFS